MKVLLINVDCGAGSTGKICYDIANKYSQEGHKVKIAYGRDFDDACKEKYGYKIGNKIDITCHAFLSRLTDKSGFYSKNVTEEFIKWVEEYNPDLIHLHNLHGYYINLEVLFNYLKTCNKKIVWTLHDCWAFTGHCAYFDYVKCSKWKEGCFDCPEISQYPKAYTDNSKCNYLKKKELFIGIKNLSLIVPSSWLAERVKQSFLKEYPVEIVPNEVNKDIFVPRTSNFKERYNINDKKMILGVASVWDRRKGLEDFVKLSSMLDDNYVIVLVGLNEKQIKSLPKNIIGITRTNNQIELAEIYTAADVYVNTSKEETFGMTSIEAISCGTPIIVYKDTACEEIAKNNGYEAVDQTVESIYQRIITTV